MDRLTLTDAPLFKPFAHAYQVAERLKAYEDTGLEPGEVRKLVKAKEDGRLVVLPCKVGDTVYQTDGVRVYENKIKAIVYDAGHIASVAEGRLHLP